MWDSAGNNRADASTNVEDAIPYIWVQSDTAPSTGNYLYAYRTNNVNYTIADNNPIDFENEPLYLISDFPNLNLVILNQKYISWDLMKTDMWLALIIKQD